MSEKFSVIGSRLPRSDAIEKVKGEVKFPSDIFIPGMLYARFLRSPHAHARIKRIDTRDAEALPGVKRVLTFKNVPDVHVLAQLKDTKKFEYLLDTTVHHTGEEVAAVAGVTVEVADEALNLIEIEYEVFPAVYDKEEAMKPSAPLAHLELDSNLFNGPQSVDGKLSLEYGDIEKGFAEADCIIEGTYESPFQHPMSPEPRSVLCNWVGGNLTCWSSTQTPQATREDVASALGIPLSSVRVIAAPMVGGYGGKSPEKTASLTALMARETGRPVKAVFSRAEDFIGTHRRIGAKISARTGVKKDGIITALDTKMITNFGRDSRMSSLIPTTSAVGTCSTLYRYENSRFESYHVITNIEDHGPMNGFGDPEAGLCIERLMDEAAEKIGMDPVEFRLKNCMRGGDKGIEPYDVTSGNVQWGIQGPDIDSLPECIRKVVKVSGWKDKWHGWGTPVEMSQRKKIGIGIAIGMHHCMAGAPDYGVVKMNQDGTVDVFSSDPELGQGLKTGMTQVMAEVFGLRFEDVNVVLSDTSVTPYGAGIFGSRGMLAAVGAVFRAAQDAKQKLFEVAAPILGVKPDELEAKARRIYVKENSERGVSIAEVCRRGYQIVGDAILPYPWFDESTGKKVAPVSVAAAVAEVEVDIETGELEVLRLTSAHDCGKAINPTSIENQIDLSLTMANGWVRAEEIVIDRKTGIILNPNLLDYKLMTVLDMPRMEDFRGVIVEVPCPNGPYGAKGMAETGTTVGAPAIANAIYNAIGVRIRGDHFTPDRILEALGK